MTIRWMMVVTVGLLAGVAAAQDAPAPESQKEKLSYALGMLLGNQLRDQSIEADLDLVVQGLKDAHSGSKTRLTEEEVRAVLKDLQSELRRKQTALQGEKLLETKKAGETFLADNKTKEGVVTLESGLQYKILKAGDGQQPTLDDTVVCHYRGTLIDGTEFDSSFKRSKPATLPVKKVIKGWSEALQLMPVGSRWQLFVPSSLAYRDRGLGHVIGPNATLIFEVELISIKDTSGNSAGGPKKRDSTNGDFNGIQEAAENRVQRDDPRKKAVPAAAAVTSIKVSYKLDPRLTRGLYMGDRWVSPPTYTTTSGQDGSHLTVAARAHGLDASGQPRTITAKWMPADPEMVRVTPSEGNEVNITVLRAGESRLEVAAQGVSRKLLIKAEHRNNALACSFTSEHP